MGKIRDETQQTVVHTPDRVWVTFGQTVQINPYEPAKVDVGMASDVRSDETVEKAIARVEGIIEEEMRVQVRALEKIKKQHRKS
jgi:hypothetical protein